MRCEAPCGKLLPCNHECARKCSEDCTNCLVCLELQERAIGEARDSAKKRAKNLKRQGKKRKAFSTVVTDSSEFDAKRDLVLKYIVQDHGWYPTITKIERVVNPKLEQKWWQVGLGLDQR